MIDLHCHILPGLDDGARDLETALEMARVAVADGITDVVATPHAADGLYRTDAASIRVAVAAFRTALATAGLPLRVHMGSEVHVHPELVRNVAAGRLLTVNDAGRYILLELPVTSIPPYFADLLHELRTKGLTPILAHPERHAVLRDDPDRLAAWVEDGMLVQLTASSLLGGMGRRAKASAETMVRRRIAHLVASDGHSPARRPPQIRAAHDALLRIDPRSAARMSQNARSVLAGERCDVPEPERKKRRWWLY